ELRLPIVVALGVHGLHLGLGSERLGLDERRASVVDVGPGALDLGLLVQNARARGIQVGPGLVDLGLEDIRVDPSDDLVFLDDRVEVDLELLDLSGNLAADLDDDDGVEVAGGRDRGGEGASLNARGAVLGRAAAALRVEIGEDASTGQQRYDDDRYDPSHHWLDAATFRSVSRPSAPADRAIQPGQGNPIIGQGLALGVLRLGQGELGVRQFENGADAGVEPALRQAKVLLGGSDQRLGGEDSLLGLLDRNLSLLDVLDDVELSGFHGGPGAFEQSLRLLIPRDPTAAIE